MKATDGEELRNKISKDFEMVGEVGRTGVRSSCWTSTTHEHIVFRKKLCKRVLGMHELVVIPSSKESGTLPSPTMTTFFFLFVFSLAHHSGEGSTARPKPRHVQLHRPRPACDFWSIFAEFPWISYLGQLAGPAVAFLAMSSPTTRPPVTPQFALLRLGSGVDWVKKNGVQTFCILCVGLPLRAHAYCSKQMAEVTVRENKDSFRQVCTWPLFW